MEKYRLERIGEICGNTCYDLYCPNAEGMRNYLNRANLPYIQHIEKRDPDKLYVWLEALAGWDDEAELSAIVSGYFAGVRVIPRHFQKLTDFIPGKPDPKASWHQGGEVRCRN